jgi:predicted permease
LLSSAGLLIRSFRALSEVSPGFDAHNVLVLRLTGSYAETADIPKLRVTVRNTLDALATIPGVQDAAASLFLPGVPFKFPMEITSPDISVDPNRKITAESRYVSAGYLATLHIPLLTGQACDANSQTRSALINRSFATTYFGGSTNPIGHHVQTAQQPPGDTASTISGIVGDAREEGLDQEPVPTVYFCGPPLDPNRYYLLRTAGDPTSLATAIREKFHSVEPGRAVYDLAPLTTYLSDAYSDVKLRTLLLTLFAATALALACIGLYGTMSYFVTTRRREIGLRMALGAERTQIGLHFTRQGLIVTAIGVGAGLVLAFWSARFLSGLLYDVGTHDLAALSIAVVAMMGVALVATAFPAFRAARVDPMQILREE